MPWLCLGSCFGLFGRSGEGPTPVTLNEVREMNVRMEQLEGMRGDVGPQLRPEQITALVGQARRAALEMRDRASLSGRERSEFDRLRVNLIALETREHQLQVELVEAEGAAYGRALSEEERERFEAKLFELRTNHDVCPDERARATITDADREEMEYLCRHYPGYVRELMQNEKLMLACFKWAFRSGCSIHVFVQFPKMAEKLMECHADKRFGAAFGHRRDDPGLRVHRGRVEMNVHGGVAGYGCHGQRTYVPLHDPKLRVALTNRVDETAPPYIVTVGEIFRQLKGKTVGYENIEVIAGGLANWNTIKCGSFDPTTGTITRLDPMRWREAPAVAIVAINEIRARYPGEEVTEAGVKWAVGISRQFPDTPSGPRVDNTHAFMTVFIPIGEGRYKEIVIGMQPYFLPKSFMHKLWLIGSTEMANIHIIDESRYLIGDMKEGGFRAHRGHILNLDGAEDGILDAFIAREIQRGFDGKKIFAPQGNNCANFVQKCFWKLFVDPQLFRHLRRIAEGHANRNMTHYLDAIERATKASNDEALQRNIERFIQNLNRQDLITLVRGCHDLLRRTLFKDHPDRLPPLQLERMRQCDFRDLKDEALTFFMETLKSTQMFRQRIREADTSVGPFNWMNKGFNWLIKKGWVSEGFVNTMYHILLFVFFGSWRFTILSTEKGARFKSLLTSKYHQAGTIPHPAAYRKWEKRVTRSQYELRSSASRLNSLRITTRSASVA